MDRLRLLLILTEFPPRIGGMQAHAHHLAKGLVEAGHEVQVLTVRPEDPAEAAAAAAWDREAPYPLLRELSRVAHEGNLRRAEALARRFRPDLVYASTVYYGELGPRLGLPLVCRSVGNDLQRPWLAYPFSFGSRLLGHPAVERHLVRWYRRMDGPEWVERLLLAARRARAEAGARAAALILANSAYTQEALLRAGVDPARVQVLPGGVDAVAFRRPQPSDKAALRAQLGVPGGGPLMLCACRLVGKKGVDDLIRALPDLQMEVPGLRLAVVGDGPLRARLQRLALDLGVAEDVHFAGAVPLSAMPPWYWAADLLAAPSRVHRHPRTGLVDAETMGRTLCEAHAAGLPVVAALSGGIPSIVRHEANGLLFREGDRADLVRQARRILEDPALGAKLAAQGLEDARGRHDWSVILAAHLRAFQEVTGIFLTAAESAG